MFTFEAHPTLQEVPQGLTSADLKPSLLIRFHENASSDIDADGVRDRRDNCAAAANPAQDDWDGDGVVDARDVALAESAVGARRRSSPLARQLDTDRDGVVGEQDLSRWLSVYLELQSGGGGAP
jgi:hypothetical protein